MTFVLLLLLQCSAFAQKDIYSLTDEKTRGIPTIRLRPTRFLVYQSLASSSKANAQKEFSEAISRNRNQVTQANIIPIGILNADIETPDEKQKKKDFVLMASPIQKDIFQANVQFQLSPKLLQSNIDNQIKSIEISFDNGDSWKSYKYEEQLISHQFKVKGEQQIGFKINSKKGTYVTFATVDVKQLVRRASVEPKRVSAPSVKGGRVAANVNGAEYRIITGCDGIFDKPIIIAEGFDAAEDVNLDDLEASYFDALQLYRNNGYDLVLVNYDNGRTWIQDNAQVLKAVINQVNATKFGSNKLVVIGESMSGLVARWALKEMENAGQNHNVSHFVAFDTPMRGANVPPGLIQFRRWLPGAFFPISYVLSLLNDIFDAYPEVHAIDEPAAKQMLLTQDFTNPAPEFFQFQTAINGLGYPSQYGIKNIALINGALDGSAQRKYSTQDIGNGRFIEVDQGPLNQGDKLLDWDIFIIGADVYTHNLNSLSRVFVSNGGTNVFVSDQTLNRDQYPGGRISKRLQDTYPSFCFVPNYSAIDYYGTLNNNNDYYLNIRNFRDNVSHQVTNSILTPFAAIYGNDENNFHADPNFETDAFNTFGRIELGMINNGCIGCVAGSGGLQGTYFADTELAGGAFPNFSTVDEVNYHLDQGRPTVLGGFQNVSARWEGSIQVPITGTYTFNMRSDDGCRVWLDGVSKVDDWGYYGAKDHPFQVTLNAGERKNLKIEWKQGGGGYVAEFYWTFNGIPAIVPRCSLFPTATGGGGTGGGVAPDRTELGFASDNGASNPGNEGESQAFDNSNFTKWLVFSSTGNIVYDFANDDNYAINSYTVTSANDSPDRDPRSWNLQGSNDGSNWNTVDSRNNQTFPNRFQTITYNISNTTPYKQ
ncbi:MAG: PA14 domain-containing protein [Arcicella sp.]|nr:PA14 domain-containing protein [Arcicella sp.]